MIRKYDVKYTSIRWIFIIFLALLFGFTAKQILGFGNLGLVIGSGIGATLVHFYLYYKYRGL
ncbi:MAG: hypothetical protein FD178_3696 [Ignavibacteria bacterium]|nr:MAG: hypothetical protein FD178_3696 [Ignavibacteria bacterium]